MAKLSSASTCLVLMCLWSTLCIQVTAYDHGRSLAGCLGFGANCDTTSGTQNTCCTPLTCDPTTKTVTRKAMNAKKCAYSGPDYDTCYAPTPYSTSDTCCYWTGIDFYGADIKQEVVADEGACCALCAATAGCTHWTYHQLGSAEPTQICYLKSGKGIPTSTTFISGRLV